MARGRPRRSAEPGPLHHKLCHALGGTFDLPRQVHSIVLPHATAYNRSAAAGDGPIARALGATEPAGGCTICSPGWAPTALRDLGWSTASAGATRGTYYNPATVARDGVRALLEDAHGRRPPAPGQETT